MSFRPAVGSRRISNLENEGNRTKRLSEAKPRSTLGDLNSNSAAETTTTTKSTTVAMQQPLSLSNSVNIVSGARNPLLQSSRTLALPKSSSMLTSSLAAVPPLSRLAPQKPPLRLPSTRSQMQAAVPQPAAVPIRPVEQLRSQPRQWSDALPECDRNDLDDPKFVAEYVQVIFDRLVAAADACIPGDYLAKQRASAAAAGGVSSKSSHGGINEMMRAVLVDWLVEVHWKFKLYPETLFLTVSLLDRFLAKTPDVSKAQFQLVGTTCLLIAAKYEDIYAPDIKDLVMICEKTYKKEEILAMECKILNTLDFQITVPGALLFLLRLGKIQVCDERQFYLAQYCLELSLTQYSLWATKSPLAMAAAALYLSNKLLRKQDSWSPVVAEMCGLYEPDLKPIAKEICNILSQTSSSSDGCSGGDHNVAGRTAVSIKAVRNKFSQSRYHCVAKMVL